MAAGRPTKLTPELQEKIVTCVRNGSYMESCAIYAGVNKTTLYDWMKRGNREMEWMEKNNKKNPRKKEAPYVDFSNALEKAMVESEMQALGHLIRSKDWKAHAWRLERRFPNRWGRSDKLQLEGNMEHQHEIEGEVNVKHDLFADIDQYAEVIRQAEERRRLSEGDASEDGPGE